MGNLQGSEGKQKTGKSPGKSKNLIKNLSNKKSSGGKGKKAEVSNVGAKSVQDVTEDASPAGVTVCREVADVVRPSSMPALVPDEVPAGGEPTSVGSELPTVTSQQCEVQNKAHRRSQAVSSPLDPNLLAVGKRKETTPPSKESSSESVFTDPLTPGGFAAELNVCYYSEESVSATPEDAVLHPEKQARLDKLSVSRVSRVSLDDHQAEDNHHVFLVTMPDACAANGHSMDSGLGSQLPTQMFNRDADPVTGQHSADPNDSGVLVAGGKLDESTSPDAAEYKPKGSSFTLTRHRKVEILPSRPSDASTIQGTESRDHRRHSSMSDSPVGVDSNVLRKVASLTLDRATLESKVSKPKFVPEKLDFQIYEKFEGQMLVNWFVSAFADDHYLRILLTGQDLRILGTQYCTHLLAAGVLRQITDKDAPNESIFRPDLMYYWAHTEAPSAPPATPGRIQTVLWPPTQDCPASQKLNDQLTPNSRKKKMILTGLDNKLDSIGQTDAPKCDNEIINLKIQTNEQDIITINNRIAIENNLNSQRIKELENQISILSRELDKYKTLVEIQSLTQKTLRDFGSPEIEERSDSILRNSTNGQLSKNVDFGKMERAEPFFNNETGFADNYNKTKSNAIDLVKSYDESCISSSEKQTIDNSSPAEPLEKDSDSKSENSPISLSKRESLSNASTAPCSSPPLPDLEANSNYLRSLSPISDSDFPPPPSISSEIFEKNNVKSIQPISAINGSDLDFEPMSLSPPPPSPLVDKMLPSILEIESLPSPPPASPELNNLMKSTSNIDPQVKSVASLPPPISSTTDDTSQSVISNIEPIPDTVCPPPPPPPPLLSGMDPIPAAVGPPPPPPPPPLSGMGPPPPPPPPGMGPPPPPPPPGMGPPPPPPPPGMGPPPPPPPPGMNIPPPPPIAGGSIPPPPPGSGIPPPPGVTPVPFPAPPVGGWQSNRATLRKEPVNPTIPMKPLYWTRILAPSTPNVIESTTDDMEAKSKPLWLEIEETTLDNIGEFADLFSRQVVTRKPTKKKIEKPVKVQAAKILDGKRFQNVGILAQSLHVDFSEIEHSIYNFDTNVVSLEALHQIYEARATDEELSSIKKHLSTFPEIPLDKPETFLFDLSEIQSFAERISCFTFQAEFDDSIMAISSKVDNIKRTCDFLMVNEGLKKLFAIILTLGNYMNGGNMQRGQADGFGLEILSKLRDVKSKDSSVTLLHFIVKTYISQCKEGLETVLPIPEPGDIGRASYIYFDEVTIELSGLQNQWDGCQKKTNKVLNESSEENLQPFKDKMTKFLETAEKQLLTEKENLAECQNKFISTMKFYQYSPKGPLEECSPKEFFDLWSQFCRDFKDIWNKEQQKIIKEKLKEKKKAHEERIAKIHHEPKKEGGLKARLQKLASKNS